MLQLVLENVLEKGRYNEMKRGNKGLQEIRWMTKNLYCRREEFQGLTKELCYNST
jgi:hypothetical protein